MININATLGVQIINMLILIPVLNRIMYQPIKKIAQERNQRVQEGLAEAHRLAQETEQERSDYERTLRRSRREVRERLSSLRQETAAKAMATVEKAQQEAKERQNQNLALIEREMEQARLEVRAQAELVAKSLAHSVLGREVP